MKARLRAATIASLAALIVATVGAGVAAAKAKPKGQPVHYCTATKTSHKPRKPRRQCSPTTLTRQLRTAKTGQQRIAAITSIAGASALGVYQPNGKRVVGGAEAGPHDLYLYTFMVKSLADQMARGAKDYSSFDQEAAVLSTLKITLNGHPVTGRGLEAAVAGGIKRLPKNPTGAVDTLGAVVRDLGTARHISWSHPSASSAPILDPLQRYLILVDITRPIIHSAALKHRAADTTVAGTRAHAAACDGNFAGQASGVGIGARFLLGAINTPAGLLTQLVLDGVEGTAFAYSFSVTAVNEQGNHTKFGTNGPQSGDPLDFRVKTEMLDDLSSTVINCGALVGYTVPGKGPLSGTTISWSKDKLPDLGTVTCGASCATTNGDGIATLHYQPYDELLPGQGPLITVAGAVQASAFPSKSAGNILGAIMEALGINKFATFGYTVSYHDPGGYRVQIPNLTSTGVDSLDGSTHAFTDHIVSTESCDLAASTQLEIKGNPVQPQPYLGLSPSPSPTSSWTEDDTVTDNMGNTFSNPGESTGGPAGFQMGGFDYPTPSIPTDWGFADLDSGGSIGALEMSGQWVLQGNTLMAQITANRQGVQPGKTTLLLPVTRATDCGQ